MPTPSQSCPDCGRKMTYDPLLSVNNKRNPESNSTAFWCVVCSFILVQKRFNVKDAVGSVRQYIFQGHLP
jgi:hypothetical protein